MTANLWADGAVMLGKLNMDEFAMGSSNETSAYGPVINPWRVDGVERAAGAGRLLGRLGDARWRRILCAGGDRDRHRRLDPPAGGVHRRPSGVKPTYGRCSRWGIVAFASSLDQAGPIARDVRDAAILLKSMASVDPKDTTSVDVPVPDYEAALGAGVKGLRIGIPKEYRVDGMPAEIEALWEQGQGMADGGGRDDRRHLAAAHEIRAAGLLHRRAGRGLVQPRAL